MDTNLADLTFTNGNDFVIVENGKIVNNSRISTFSGNDTIEASLIGDFDQVESAIENFGLIKTTSGNDSIIGRYIGFDGNGILNSQDAVINTGKGNDFILGKAGFRGTNAILNQGTIFMDSGHDLISNIDDDPNPGSGVINEPSGIINTGRGNDSIILDSDGFYGGSALYNQGLITTGSGNDHIDTRQSGVVFPVSPTIANSGTIEMGKGHDILTGALIDNTETINMGRGSDFIEASFIGGGNTNLGPGDDSVSISVWPGDSNSQIINGGSDFDQVEFSFELNDDVELNIIGNVVEVEFFDSAWNLYSAWNLNRFELFIFDGESKTFEELSDL